ncbi:Carboxylic ester hydrolase [Trichostrongylus colubriformis]|uniref:Carboxylic ester hydrolase n=1 Tax=Trichostrongylus colubriformis TaxID=6319 RepID=A0AAN8F3L5_TRICO
MKIRSRARISSLTLGKAGILANKAADTECVVRTNYGLIQGKHCVTKDGYECDCFLGVPYAKPPVGELRFKKPHRMDPWEGVKKCRQFGNRSVQEDMPWDKVTIFTPQSEDCLYLNIFAPTIDPTKSYPVLFYIHGGGFMMDSAVRYKPENMARLIVSQEVILVTIQYRLGFLGYFCTGDNVAKGNYGLWDQLEALKWTKENIHHFGGDPNRITVAGQSAGAVSADLLSISPLSRGMFNRKIVMGGNSFCYWSTTTKEKCAEYCRKKALKLGWKPRSKGYASKEEESLEILDFMRTVPARRLGTHMVGNSVFFNEARLPLTPVIDGEILPKAISELRAEAPSMESITGVGTQESLLFMALGAIRGTGKDMDKLVHELARKTQLHVAEVKEVVGKVYGDLDKLRRDRKAMQNAYITCTSDIFANYGCYRYLEHSQKHNKNTYAYRFDYTSRNMWGWLAVMIPYLAGTHSSDIIYLFDCNYFTAPLPMTKTDRKISRLTSSSFMEFVKTGNPNASHLPCTWEPVAKNGEMRLLNINEKPAMIDEIFDKRIQRIDDCLKEILSRRSQA